MIDELVYLVITLFNYISSNNISILKRLTTKHGCGILKEIRQYEKQFLKLLKAQCDTEFLRISLLYNLTPKFVRYRLWNKKYVHNRIHKLHQRHYLQLEYHNKCKQTYQLHQQIETMLPIIDNKLNPFERKLLKDHFNKIKEKQQKKIKITHAKKIFNLSNGNVILQEIDTKKVIQNVSSRELSNEEETILSKGLEFCIETKIKDTLQFKTEIEMMAHTILKQLDEPQCKSLDKCLINCIKRAAYQSLKINKNKKTINISSDELRGLKSLLNDKSIVLMKADKGRACVLMDKQQYILKVKQLLSTGNTFKKMDNIDERGNVNTIEYVVNKMEGKLNYRIGELKRINKLSKDEHKWIKADATRCPVMFCQPKVHKTGMPLRPVISTSNSYNYNLSKYLTNLLEAARSKPTSHVKDSFSFAKSIKQQKPSKNDFMISLDVESLFTSIPVHESIDLAIKTILQQKMNDSSFTKLEETDLRQLFELCVTNMPFRFYDELYQQTEGVSMGSPLAPALADLFMTYIESKLEDYEHNDKIKTYYRYVDDTFIVINGKERDADNLLEYVNSLHPNIKFTCEKENNFEISFLDVKIIRERTKFETTIFRKKSHTGQLLHWQSCQAKKYKVGLIRTLTFRALSICSSKILLNEECKIIESLLTRNGYPLNLVKRKMKNTIDQFNKTKLPNLPKKIFFVPITYHGHETILMANKIKNMIEKIYPMTNVIFGYGKGLSLIKLFTKNYKGVDPMNLGVVYKLTCMKCHKVYIGQTHFDVKHRMKQHKNGLRQAGNSAAADHVLNNKDHGINFDRPEILARDKSKKRREIKETLLTMKHPNSYNTISHELAIFD
jgi:hypothetical protein